MSEETISEEQVLHNKLSFEINQELIHLMKRIIEIQRANKQLKEVINELNEALNHIDDNIIETCEVYDVNGIELKKILNKIKEN